MLSVYEMWQLRKGKSKFVPLVYLAIPFILIQLFSENNPILNRNLVLFIFILTWTFDTFAYLIGIRFGKHKISPSISPKKSWEGFISGYIFTIFAAYIYSQYFSIINPKLAISISIFLPFTATLGDFIESHYKRKANAKDSGKIIPGHGGILDRMDSFTITIPAVYILTKLL